LVTSKAKPVQLVLAEGEAFSSSNKSTFSPLIELNIGLKLADKSESFEPMSTRSV
jgi:hypothetical protein